MMRKLNHTIILIALCTSISLLHSEEDEASYIGRFTVETPKEQVFEEDGYISNIGVNTDRGVVQSASLSLMHTGSFNSRIHFYGEFVNPGTKVVIRTIDGWRTPWDQNPSLGKMDKVILDAGFLGPIGGNSDDYMCDVADREIEATLSYVYSESLKTDEARLSDLGITLNAQPAGLGGSVTWNYSTPAGNIPFVRDNLGVSWNDYIWCSYRLFMFDVYKIQHPAFFAHGTHFDVFILEKTHRFTTKRDSKLVKSDGWYEFNHDDYDDEQYWAFNRMIGPEGMRAIQGLDFNRLESIIQTRREY